MYRYGSSTYCKSSAHTPLLLLYPSYTCCCCIPPTVPLDDNLNFTSQLIETFQPISPCIQLAPHFFFLHNFYTCFLPILLSSDVFS